MLFFALYFSQQTTWCSGEEQRWQIYLCHCKWKLWQLLFFNIAIIFVFAWKTLFSIVNFQMFSILKYLWWMEAVGKTLLFAYHCFIYVYKDDFFNFWILCKMDETLYFHFFIFFFNM